MIQMLNKLNLSPKEQLQLMQAPKIYKLKCQTFYYVLNNIIIKHIYIPKKLIRLHNHLQIYKI